MINVSELITDPDFTQEYVVTRTSGTWVKGKFTLNTPVDIPTQGVITACNVKDLKLVPEADRVSGMMCFYSTGILNVTRSNDSEEGISDTIVWRGDRYKIVQVLPEIDYGYYKAFGARIVGK